jgi:hypothetical protein
LACAQKNELKPHLSEYWCISPKHGSWLNIAEIELRVLTGPCLNRRIAKGEVLEAGAKARQHRRNKGVRRADWRFAIKDARIQLKHLYPTLQT